MNEINRRVFAALFREAVNKCFSHQLEKGLTETECRQFSDAIFESTGLVIGWKSLKNYSIAVAEGERGKNENPSTSTLDTLCRYVANAPYSNEQERKEKAASYSFWFGYRTRFIHAETNANVAAVMTDSPGADVQISTGSNKQAVRRPVKKVVLIFVLLAVSITGYFYLRDNSLPDYSENFSDCTHLENNGWMVITKDTNYWNQRSANHDVLTLFTLFGDNWPDPRNPRPAISNLLLRKINHNNFRVSVDLKDFIPTSRWQQAGIILLENKDVTSSSIRLSLAFNDDFGGYTKSPEILVQAIKSPAGINEKPEEVAHYSLLALDSLRINPALKNNFNYTSLQVEKTGDEIRLLFAAGKEANAAYREIKVETLRFTPRYVGIFAIRGFTEKAAAVPVLVDGFRITKL